MLYKWTFPSILLLGLTCLWFGPEGLWGQASSPSSVQSEDPFAWLEESESPQVQNWLDAQEAKLLAYFASLPSPLPLYQQVEDLFAHEAIEAPVKRGKRYFFLKQCKDRKQKILYVQDEKELRALIDPNLLCQEGKVALTDYEVSPDGRWVAYGLSRAGSDWERWHIREVETGQDLDETLDWIKFSKPVWTCDQQGLFYSRYLEPAKGQHAFDKLSHHQLCYHRLGTLQSEDVLVYARPDCPDWIFGNLRVLKGGEHLLFTVNQGTNLCNGVYALSLKQASLEASVVTELIPLQLASFAFLGDIDGHLYFKTNHQAARERIIAFPFLHPEQQHWREVVGEHPHHSMEEACLVGQRCAVAYLQDVCARLQVFRLDGTWEREIPLPGKGSIALSGSAEESEFFYGYTDFLTSSIIMSVDADSGRQSLFFKPRMGGDFADYTVRQVFYPSHDGMLIPLFIVHRKDLIPTSQTPLLLYGYGGFAISITPHFDPLYLAWMQRGGVFALANIRGGGEYGEKWHEAGSLSRKQTCFDDFMAGAKWLIANGYTSSSKLALMGRSNGGLLVGACLTQRPDLFKAAIVGVGVLDMLKFHQFTIGGSWVYEYGSPEDPLARSYLKKYSPYHNIDPALHYPSTLILTGDRDDRVAPVHSFKFAAALQAAQRGKNSNPILLRLARHTGHGAGKSLEQACLEKAAILQFLLRELQVDSAS